MEYNPITLPASKMLATMTTLIGEVRNRETLAPSDIVNELVDSCRIGKVDFGKGIVNNFKVHTLPQKDLSETSSAFTIVKPNVEQETILIDTYKFIELSLSEILTRDAVLSGDMLNSFFEFVMSLMEDTAKFNLFDVMNGLYQDWVPGQASQTVEINQIDVAGMTGAELQATLQWNASEVGRVMRKTINNMKIKNTKFTDIATFTDVNTGETENVETCLSDNRLKIVFNDKYYTKFLADAMASLYHADKVGEMIPSGRFVLLPEDAMAGKNSRTIAWVHDIDKFALADFYSVTLGIQDPSTTYTNRFFHYAYGAGIFKYLPGVKFVVNVITPAK